MSPFRGSDEALDREIAAIEGIAKVRVRRVSSELRELERDLREHRRERVRRRAEAAVPTTEGIPAPAETA
jgi:CHASE1-domain containing sensor protein